MSNTIICRGLVAGLGAAAATLAAVGLATTANADDIDMYGGTDTNTVTIGLGPMEEIIKTTTNYFDTVNETTGIITPDFSGPTVTTSFVTLPGGEQTFGYSFLDQMAQYFGDSSNFVNTTSAISDSVTPGVGEMSVFDPLAIFDTTPIPIVDMDPIPF